MSMKLKDDIINKINVETSINALGVHVNHDLNWIYEYENVENKTVALIKKTTRVEVRVQQGCANFSVHVLTNIHFGCGTVKFNKK